MQLRSVQCDGLVTESLVHVESTDAGYQETLRWLGSIERGEKAEYREGSATLPAAAQRQRDAQALVGAGSVRL
jgi:hypothetical protein